MKKREKLMISGRMVENNKENEKWEICLNSLGTLVNIRLKK